MSHSQVIALPLAPTTEHRVTRTGLVILSR
jgi:hypothetical protein